MHKKTHKNPAHFLHTPALSEQAFESPKMCVCVCVCVCLCVFCGSTILKKTDWCLTWQSFTHIYLYLYYTDPLFFVEKREETDEELKEKRWMRHCGKNWQESQECLYIPFQVCMNSLVEMLSHFKTPHRHLNTTALYAHKLWMTGNYLFLRGKRSRNNTFKSVNMDSANAWELERGGYQGNKWEKGIS